MTNKYLAMFSEQTTILETKQRESQLASINSTITEATQLASAAAQALNLSITEEANRFYGLMIASSSTERVSAASGAELAQAVVSLVCEYYSGNKEALQPVVDACNMWIASKYQGDAKTANIPNNLRLLVSRKSEAYAQDNGLNIKLTLSAEGVKGAKAITIKEASLKAKPRSSKAKRLFNTIAGLDASDCDELIQTIAADGELLNKFSALLALIPNQQQIKPSYTRESVAQLEARVKAAAAKEDKLQDEMDDLEAAKDKLIAKLASMREELEENEKALTAKRQEKEAVSISLKRARKDDRKAELSDELEIIASQLEELLEINTQITEEVNQLAKDTSKAIDAFKASEDAWDQQAALTASLGKQISQARAQMH